MKAFIKALILPPTGPLLAALAGVLILRRRPRLGRALAALGVLGSHAWGEHHSFTPAAYDGHLDRLVFGGGYGVYVFFALSGYLLFRPLARAAFGD